MARRAQRLAPGPRRRVFITQTPKDIPGGVLGNRMQHALRAFTPDDARALRATVGIFPPSSYHDLEELLPALGIGEAIVTILSLNGVPTPVVHTRLTAPVWRMAPAGDVAAAALWARYGTRVEAGRARAAVGAGAAMTQAAAEKRAETPRLRRPTPP